MIRCVPAFGSFHTSKESRSVFLTSPWLHPHPCFFALKWKPGYFLLFGVASPSHSSFLPVPHAAPDPAQPASPTWLIKVKTIMKIIIGL